MLVGSRETVIWDNRSMNLEVELPAGSYKIISGIWRTKKKRMMVRVRIKIGVDFYSEIKRKKNNYYDEFIKIIKKKKIGSYHLV